VSQVDGWHVEHGDNRPWLASLPDKSVDVVITDPPYSEHVHSKNRAGSRKLTQGKRDGQRAALSRSVDFGFEALAAEDRRNAAREFGRLARRWVLVFSDVESSGLWREALTSAGLDYARTGAWIKIGGTPQFTGDRPAVGFEAITIAHPKGRKRWGGGGAHGVWSHCIAQNGGGKNPRLHTTQKPLPLMIELVSLFSEPGELILDPFAGSGTTGVAALRLGRRFLGCELDATYAATAHDRLTAEDAGQSLASARSGQLSLLGGAA